MTLLLYSRYIVEYKNSVIGLLQHISIHGLNAYTIYVYVYMYTHKWCHEPCIYDIFIIDNNI